MRLVMPFTKRESVVLNLFLLLLVGGIAWGFSTVVYWIAQKGKLRRTMATMRTIARAFEEYDVDTAYGLETVTSAPYRASGGAWTLPTEGSNMETLHYVYTVEQLRPLLVPRHIDPARFQFRDGWGHPLVLATSAPLPRRGTASISYAIRSFGADGIRDDSVAGRSPKSWDDDLIWSNGRGVGGWGTWYLADEPDDPYEEDVRQLNRAAAIVAKLGPVCDAFRWTNRIGDRARDFIDIVGPDGEALCQEKSKRETTVTPFSKAISTALRSSSSHGLVKYVVPPAQGYPDPSPRRLYFIHVIAPDGTRCMVATVDLDK
jgi:hypothetical protein